MDDWKKNIRYEYILPCLTLFVVFLISLIFHESQLFISYPAIHSMIETIGTWTFCLFVFLFFIVINLSYLMNRY